MTVEEVLKERGIKKLFHFTPIENLSSIIQKGLCPRDKLEELGIEFKQTDKIRIDGTNSICLSVEWPNIHMLNKKREENKKRKWILLELSSDLLCHVPFTCFDDNAAANRTSKYESEELDGDALIKMIDSNYHKKDGSENTRWVTLPDRFPTNVQAEIAVYDTISPEYITRIYFEDINDLERIGISISTKYTEDRDQIIKNLRDKNHISDRCTMDMYLKNYLGERD